MPVSLGVTERFVSPDDAPLTVELPDGRIAHWNTPTAGRVTVEHYGQTVEMSFAEYAEAEAATHVDDQDT